ncbi:hypothetical protein TNCV_536261 [Trichonephila clavipes]|nr:hypothetical protein TNCV_536261 [Trichonephila clavipes]
MTINLTNIIIGSKDYEEEFVRAQLSVILEERAERETKEKIARHMNQRTAVTDRKYWSNVKRTSCAKIVKGEQEMAAVMDTGAQMPVYRPGMTDLEFPVSPGPLGTTE